MANTASGTVHLHRVTDESGVLTTSQVLDSPLTRESLTTDDVYVLVAGGSVYAWGGKGASAAERKNAMSTATAFVATAGLPPTAPVKIVKEGTEPPLFKQAFHRWSAPVVNAGQPPVKPKRTKKAIDVSAMAAGTPVKDQDRGRTFDDGASGDLTIWKIEKFDKVLLDQSDHGTFHAGDSYIVQYDYGSSKKDHVIYFWQGRDSTADEKGASALLATALSDSLGGQVPIIRVPMGKEPDHFYSLFKGRMVVRSGGVAGGFRNTDEKDTSAESSGVALFLVRGTDDVNTRAVQGELLFTFTSPHLYLYLRTGD